MENYKIIQKAQRHKVPCTNLLQRMHKKYTVELSTCERDENMKTKKTPKKAPKKLTYQYA